MDFIFILVKPAIPENIGASARALKTMGFGCLRIVNSKQHLKPEAKILAHASNDVLDNVVTFNSLKEAIADVDFVIGTTARGRTKLTDYHPVENTIEIIEKKQNNVNRVGVVFGCEESGLSNNDIQLCNMISCIPLENPYPSLNLSQAVMIYAYSFSKFARNKLPINNDKQNINSWNVLQNNISSLLIKLDIKPSDLIYTRIMERVALIGNTDINLLHSIISAINKKYNNT